MTYLLDTHAFVWMAEGDRRLNSDVRSMIADKGNEVLLSIASLWEIAIKVSIGKLELAAGFSDLVESADSERYSLFPIDTASVTMVTTLPLHHRDPFDRLLAATALQHDVALISADSVFDLYGVKRVW